MFLRKARVGKSLRQVIAWLNMPTIWPQVVSNSDAFRRISGFDMGQVRKGVWARQQGWWVKDVIVGPGLH